MDPNANLAEQRRIFAAIEQLHCDGNPDNVERDDREFQRLSARLVDLAIALDEWLSNGGFAPRAWQPKPHCEGGYSICSQCTEAV